jgi:hypothetical protein
MKTILEARIVATRIQRPDDLGHGDAATLDRMTASSQGVRRECDMGRAAILRALDDVARNLRIAQVKNPVHRARAG